MLTLLMLPVLLGLGSWQVQRLHWKEQLLATIDKRIHDAPLEIPHVSAASADYRPARAFGTFEHDKAFYIFASDRVTGNGGYHVLTPLHLTSGEYLLVDRGWIPYEAKDNPKDYVKPEGPQDIGGIMRMPQKPGLMQPVNIPEKGYWYSIDLPAMAAADGIDKFLPYILEIGTDQGQVGYPIGGQTRLMLPNNHLEYALTWFGFAAILLAVYVISSWQRNDEE